MSLTYSTYISQIANITVISSNDASFQVMMPGAIDYAEQRIYRESDFLATYIGDIGNCTANSYGFVYPTNLGTFLVINEMFVTTSVSTTLTSTMVIQPLQVASAPYIHTVFPSAGASGTGLPKYFSPLTATTCLLGPVPDQNYLIGVIGTQRPVPLSAANSSTFLTQTLPDLFVAATMVFVSGYMRNFSAQSDDPRMSVSWEDQYTKLFASANMEERRKGYASQGWQAQIANTIATPSRV